MLTAEEGLAHADGNRTCRDGELQRCHSAFDTLPKQDQKVLTGALMRARPILLLYLLTELFHVRFSWESQVDILNTPVCQGKRRERACRRLRRFLFVSKYIRNTRRTV